MFEVFWIIFLIVVRLFLDFVMLLTCPFCSFFNFLGRSYAKIKRKIDAVQKEFQDIWDEFGDKVSGKFRKNKCQCLCGCNNEAEHMEDKCLYCLDYHGDTHFEQQ